MNKLFGDDTATLVKGSANITVADLKSSGVVGIYFSAHWCPPCKAFTPVLTKFYNSMKATGRKFEVVFASSDKSQEQFDEYYGEMPWAALPYGDKRIAKLSSKFKVRGIPTLVLLDAATGQLIQDAGRAKVMSDPEGADFPWPKPTLSEILSEMTFSRHEGGPVSWADLSKMDAVGIYFSAHWCGPCRAFTPQLVKTYNRLKKDGKKFEVIFASSDRDASSFAEYWGDMPWAALPFDNRAGKDKLSEFFSVEGIPTFIIIDPKTNKVLSSNGRAKVMGDKTGENFPWRPLPCEELGAGPDINSTAMVVLLTDGMPAAEAKALTDELTAVATAKKADWSGKTEEGDEDYPVDFGYGGADCGLTQPIRSFCNITKPSPVLFVLDVPSGTKYAASGAVSKASMEALVNGYVNESLTPMGIKQPLA